jgi:hypothetical protein
MTDASPVDSQCTGENELPYGDEWPWWQKAATALGATAIVIFAAVGVFDIALRFLLNSWW